MNALKYLLNDGDLPDHWYNLQADLPEALPPVLHPGSKKPITAEDLAPLFARELIAQEMSTERWIAIPEPVRQIMLQWRCTPLHRARRLEQVLDTPAKIYYKWEGVSPSGSHKPNTAVPQAYYNQQEGVKKIATETGAGQWGSSLAMACSMFDLECLVYMVRISYQQKPYRRALMEAYGASCVASPSDTTESGREILRNDPDCRGSLGIAISEAVEVAAKNEDTRYCLGSVLNHVMLHQTVIGLEAIKQLEIAGDYPDMVIGCTGGGSNFAGISFPFLGEKLRGGTDVRLLAVEPSACPTLTRGPLAYDYGDTAKLTPLVKMHTLGSGFVPAGMHSGGLRYHGMAPMVSHIVHLGLAEARAINQMECFAAGMTFAKTEGILPAPEATHAVAATIQEALRCKEAGKSETLLFNLCGHGNFDMQAYMDYQAGKLADYAYPEQEIAMALSGLPPISRPTG